MTHARALPYVEDLTIFGNALHILVRNEVSDAQVAEDLRKATGVEVDIRPIAASLEDVFVRLTRMQIERRGDVPEAAPAAHGGAS